MISKAFMTVLFTGFIAGIIVTVVQMLKVTPLILQAETYELDEVAIKSLLIIISKLKMSMMFKLKPQQI